MNNGMKRLLFVLPDSEGDYTNADIWAAFEGAAQAFAAQGWPVTVAAIRAQPVGRASEATRLGPEIEQLVIEEQDSADEPGADAPRERVLAWRVHRWLRRRQEQFSLAVFPDWGGLAYYALQARRQGLDYVGLPLAVYVLAPLRLMLEERSRLPDSPGLVERDFMERWCIEHADAAACGSGYTRDWLRARHWQMPGEVDIVPPLFRVRKEHGIETQSVPQRVSRVVFFGAAGSAGVMRLFCAAVDRLPASSMRRMEHILFAGPAVTGTLQDVDGRAFLAAKRRKWAVPTVLLRTEEQAWSGLRRPGTLAVLPPLTANAFSAVAGCLRRGDPFVAPKAGVFPALWDGSAEGPCLFDPTPNGLTSVLAQAIEHGAPSSQAPYPSEAGESRWQHFVAVALQRRLERVKTQPAASAQSPLVSVCLVHHDRPQLLAQALASLRAQTYPRFELVLVDDGSRSEEAHRYLFTLDREFADRGWSIVRQPNRYLGAARNAAAATAAGDYLLFMDDDNVATPQMLERFVTAAICSGADVLTCPCLPFVGAQRPNTPSRVWVPLGGSLGAAVFRNAFGDANALWKRTAFERVGGYTTDYGVGHEDWEVFAAAVLSGLCLDVVPEPLFWYRVSPAGMLRAGADWADHARNARAFLRHDPAGLGMALAYALYMHRAGQSAIGSRRASGARRWLTALRLPALAADPVLRAQFLGAMRAQGLRAALRKALSKADCR